jgi:hypothetical protein
MVAVLDQYEVEYKETYISGTYDQIVMGKMYTEITLFGNKILSISGSRGVVYGSINSNQAKIPGTSPSDYTTSLSYRLQPYREKAGNCKAAKHVCYDERIYDTLVPNPISCFKANGANIFALKSQDPYSNPGATKVYAGVDLFSSSWIMFDNYVPDAFNTQNLTGSKYNNIPRSIVNPCVDVHWTKSFPFEPRYSSIKREKSIDFSKTEATYYGSFYADEAAFVSASFQPTSAVIDGKKGPSSVMRQGLVVGTVSNFNFSNIALTLEPSSKNRGINSLSYSPPLSGNYYHHWICDVNVEKYINDGLGDRFPTTGSAGNQDLIKVLFGYGDCNTVFFDCQLTSSSDETGFARRGTNNWPEFRKSQRTVEPNPAYGFSGYEAVSGSVWSISPIIRGWKYGLYNGFPDYTSAYYRQGKYGQFRDLLEQRKYTTTIGGSRSSIIEGPVSVAFVDENDNLTDPARTHSQNLSQYATSSLPYFDLQQRNRPDALPISNLTLVGFTVDSAGNVTI